MVSVAPWPAPRRAAEDDQAVGPSERFAQWSGDVLGEDVVEGGGRRSLQDDPEGRPLPHGRGQRRRTKLERLLAGDHGDAGGRVQLGERRFGGVGFGAGQELDLGHAPVDPRPEREDHPGLG